jgi:hypothetical protein
MVITRRVWITISRSSDRVTRCQTRLGASVTPNTFCTEFCLKSFGQIACQRRSFEAHRRHWFTARCEAQKIRAKASCD